MNTVAYLRETTKKQPIIGFAGVGIISTLLDIIFLKLTLGAHFPLWLATGIGFTVGLINGYFLNSAFVFRTKRSQTSSLKYALVSLGGLGITELLVHGLAIWHPLLSVFEAKLVAVVVVFFWNYILSRLWAFK